MTQTMMVIRKGLGMLDLQWLSSVVIGAVPRLVVHDHLLSMRAHWLWLTIFPLANTGSNSSDDVEKEIMLYSEIDDHDSLGSSTGYKITKPTVYTFGGAYTWASLACGSRATAYDYFALGVGVNLSARLYAQVPQSYRVTSHYIQN